MSFFLQTLKNSIKSQLFIILLISITFSCDRNTRSLDGHWHFITLQQPIESVGDPYSFLWNLQTLDLCKNRGESNKYSLFLLKAEARKKLFSNKLVFTADTLPSFIFNYKLKNDTLYLYDHESGGEYLGLRTEPDSCLMQYHRLDGTSMEINLPLLHAPDPIRSTTLNWKNANYLLFGDCSSIRIFGQPGLCIQADGGFPILEDLPHWYEDYVTTTYNRIKVFADRHRTLPDIKRLVLKLEQLHCDSIYFAVITDFQGGEMTKWVHISELSQYISESEKDSLDKMDNERTYGLKSQNWLTDIVSNSVQAENIDDNQ